MMKKIFRFLYVLLVGLFVLLNVHNLKAQESNGWKPLGQQYSVQQLQQLVIPRDDWHPFPNVSDPTGFEKIPKSIRQGYIRQAEKLLDAKWPRLPATVFLQFKRNGNRSNYEKLSFKRRQMLATLVLAEAFERKGRFIDQIINGIWATCEESFWGVPAHMGLQKAGVGLPDVEDPVVDLFAAETAQELAWTYYLLKPELDKVSPLVTSRIEYEVRRRILIPYLNHKDWWYLGYQWRANKESHSPPNNWNPWINSNVLPTALILARDPELRLKLVYKTMDSIDNFVIPYPSDGGSDEGPEYWGRAAGSLLDYLETLKSATGGKIDKFNQPVIRNMGEFIYKTYISDPYFINYGDADAKIHPDPALLYRFGQDTGDSLLTRFASFEYRKQETGNGDATLKLNQLKLLNYPFGALNRALPALKSINELLKITPEEPFSRDVWLPDLQVMAARSNQGSSKGFYLMAKGGTNGASHNHNDVGNFIVYYDGQPVLVDAGAQTYTAKTFSSQRYEIWNNQSRYHNLPDINGVMQQNGGQYAARQVDYQNDEQKAQLSMELSGAYPKKAEVHSWKRTIRLNRGENVVLNESYVLDDTKGSITENFITPCKPDIRKSGLVVLTDTVNKQTYHLNYPGNQFKPEVEKVSINDTRMSHNWGDHLYHITLTAQNPKDKDSFEIQINTAN